MADQESGFVIDGKTYEVPTIDTFTMDEAVVLYELCGLAIEDFAVDETDTEAVAQLSRKMRHPGFVKALLQIAYQRGNPDASPAKARQVVGAVDQFAAFENMAEAEDDARPPASSMPESGGSSDDSSMSSGNGSTAVSDEPAALPAPTGIIG